MIVSFYSEKRAAWLVMKAVPTKEEARGFWVKYATAEGLIDEFSFYGMGLTFQKPKAWPEALEALRAAVKFGFERGYNFSNVSSVLDVSKRFLNLDLSLTARKSTD